MALVIVILPMIASKIVMEIGVVLQLKMNVVYVVEMDQVVVIVLMIMMPLQHLVVVKQLLQH